MNQTSVFLFLTALMATTISAIDYCSKSLCDDDKHIACKNDGKFLASCPSNAVIVNITGKLENLALTSQNNYRSQIASGKVKRYDKAARMATLVWDHELAKLAELNVRTCVFGHDKCRNTLIFKYAGQNLGMLQSTKKFHTPEYVIETITKGWFEEHKDADMNYVSSYSHHKSGKMIGHFTQLVRDEACAVGCAMSQFKEDKWYTTLYECDYSLYKKSRKAGSECKTGINKEFPGLCSKDEYKHYLDNDLFYDKSKQQSN